MRRIFVGSLVVFLFTSCSAATGGKEKSISQEVTVLEAGIYGRFQQEGAVIRVAKDQPTFTAIFGELHAGILPPPSPPEIDYGKSISVFVILDQKPTGGWSLSFKNALLAKDQLKLVLSIDRPQPGMMTVQVLTRPFVVLKLPLEKFSSIVAQTPEGRTIAHWPEKKP